MKILNVVLCGIMDNGKLLMIKRNNEPYKGYWTVPGGKIEFAEHVEQASVRETKEETGLDSKFEKICGIGVEILHENNMPKAHFVMFMVKMKALSKEIVESDEGELKWVDLNEIGKLKIVPSDHMMIKEYLIKDKTVKVNRIKVNQKNDVYDMEEFS
jgi:8-oxo-dGTP diphosphatase